MTTYKIKKEFTPMDFYDYVKSQGREKCKEFKKDFGSWTIEVGIFCPYAHGAAQAKLDKMLSERANFRRYMIEGGFVEEEKPKAKLTFSLREYCGDSYLLRCKTSNMEWTLARVYNDGRGMSISPNIDDPEIQTENGRIKIIKAKVI